MMRSLFLLALVLGTFTPAWAAELAPILDDRDAATRLSPAPGGFDAPDAVLVVTDPDEDEATDPDDLEVERTWSLVTAFGRWVTVPDALIGLLFEVHPSYSQAGFGLGFEFGSRDKAMWAFELDWTPLVPSAGNWLSGDDPPAAATYAESGLHMVSVDVSYRRYLGFTDHFHFFFGGGLGVGVLVGDVVTAEVLPICEEPVAQCAHWRGATNEEASLPTRIVPVLHLAAGFQLDIGDDAMIRIVGGLRNVLYAGLTVGMAL